MAILTKENVGKLSHFTLYDETTTLSSTQVRNAIFNWCSYFKSQQILPQSRIVVLLPPSAITSTIIYAIVYCGAVYVPLDSSIPFTRLTYIVEDAKPSLVIGRGERPDWCQYTWLDADQMNLIESSAEDAKINEEDLAVILYTSGSTGNPKGVAISHRAVNHFVNWAIQYFAITEADHINNIAPFIFDLSLFDLFVAIKTDAKLSIMPRRCIIQPQLATSWLSQQRITILYTVPNVLQFFASRQLFSPEIVQQLRLILFAGEIMPIGVMDALLKQLPQTSFYNLYGPTETNVCCFWQVTRERMATYLQLPIGQAVPGFTLELDEATQELLVKGGSLMSGYWQNESKHLPVDAKGYYHTGDKVSINSQGEYDFHGRLDQLIKFHGYRIEPIEIEQYINQFNGVVESLVFSLKQKEPNIIACIIGTKIIPQSQLIQFLREYLPHYMLPTCIIQCENFPRLVNGKCDRLRLMEIISEQVSESQYD